MRYFSPALLPNRAGSCGTVAPGPSLGPQGEGLSPCGSPVLPSRWGHPTALQAQNPVLMADVCRGVHTGHSWQKGQGRFRLDGQGPMDCSQRFL